MAHARTKKVFLGGLSPDTTREDIQEVLDQHGKVMDIQIMTEKGTNKPRGFGFAIFDDCDTVDKICIKKFIRIKVSVNVGAYGGRGKVFVCRGER